MYQALYRKYRPQTFDDVVGQLAVTQTLKTQLQSGRLSHSHLTGNIIKRLRSVFSIECLISGHRLPPSLHFAFKKGRLITRSHTHI